MTDYQEILVSLFQLCIIPLLGVLTGFIVKWVNAKSAEIKTKTDNEILQKYLDMLTATITDCVVATNQTYVDTLKKNGEFTVEAQKEAFAMTSAAVLKILSQDAIEYLTAAVGDLDEFITNKIEASVNQNKIKAG